MKRSLMRARCAALVYRTSCPSPDLVLLLFIVALAAFCSPAAHAGTETLDDALRNVVASHRGRVAVAIKNLESGESYEYRADEPMPTASLIKFPVMIAAYQAIEDGKLDPKQVIELKNEDKVPGSGILTSNFSAGAPLLLVDAIRLMIAYSDNTATNLVLDQLGLEATAKRMEELGCPHTKIHSKVYRGDTTIFPDRSKEFGLGSTTASETIKLLELLHAGKLVSKSASEQMFAHMLACDDKAKVRRFLPEGTEVANKTGSISAVRCDAGIMLGDDQEPIAYCVLTSRNRDQSWTDRNEAELLCARIGRAVYDHFFTLSTKSNDEKDQRLQSGATGPLVEALQRTLNARLKPSPGLAVDGDFGPMTEAAVTRFQTESKLETTGSVGPETWQALGTLLEEDPDAPDPEEINATVVEKLPADALDGPPHATCRVWAIGDGSSGEVLWGNNAEDPVDIASTTKIMTAFVVLRLAEKDPKVLDEIVTFSERADRTRGSTSSLRAGEKLPVRELLYGLLLPSGNDAGVALAEHFGSRLGEDSEADPHDQFVVVMNRTAQELGMDATHFENTHGITAENHKSSAKDLVTLTYHALRLSHFPEYVRTFQHGYTVEGPGGYQRNVVWKNTNRLLGIEGYHGVKTGTTSAAGACLVSLSKRGEQSLIGVVLGATSSDARYTDTRNLFRWAWNETERDTPLQRSE